MPKKPGGRHYFPAGLQGRITILDAPDKPAGARCVGYVDQRQLACDPMRWYIKVTRRLIYLAPVDEDRLNYKQLIAPLPPHPIARCKMDVSILVMLTIEKFLYHMPVWRQQQRLRHNGIDLSYSTLCSLVNRTARVLMTDTYAAYAKYGEQPGVTHMNCLSYTRRYFVYALENDGPRAAYALDHFFGPLFDIERECKLRGLDYDGITAKRQDQSLLVLQDLRRWLEETLRHTTARTPIPKAISYALKNYDALLHYTLDGMLPVDNNALEAQIRAIALGRHNHLFAGSQRSAELAAIM